MTWQCQHKLNMYFKSQLYWSLSGVHSHLHFLLSLLSADQNEWHKQSSSSAQLLIYTLTEQYHLQYCMALPQLQRKGPHPSMGCIHRGHHEDPKPYDKQLKWRMCCVLRISKQETTIVNTQNRVKY